MSVEYLDVEDLVSLMSRLEAGPIRDIGLLDSAASRPRATAFGQDAYPTIELKAAALLHSLCMNHALVDGNKRLSLLATGAFLRLNGRSFRMTQDQAFDLVMAVAEGRLDVPEIAAALTD
jgi:death-on-curing protein